jgi:hypothetical protein
VASRVEEQRGSRATGAPLPNPHHHRPLQRPRGAGTERRLATTETTPAEIIAIPEWARRVGCSPDSAYKAARNGDIPGCFGIGRLLRVNWPAPVPATYDKAAPSNSAA